MTIEYWSHLERHELYDLESDGGERIDVLAQHPQVVHELKADYARRFKVAKKPLAWEKRIGRCWRHEREGAVEG